MSKRTFLIRALVVYFLFVAASLLESRVGSELLLLFWPHLVGLAVGLTSEPSVFVLQGLGLLAVVASAIVVSALRPMVRTWRAAIGLVVTTLGAITLLVCAAAWALGWPMAV